MGKKKKHNAPAGMLEAFKKANRELELERNGGRWAAVDRPHKNGKSTTETVRKDSRFLTVLFFSASGRL